MLLSPFRWVARNLGTLLMALVLSIVVWISAVISGDPNQERNFAVTIGVIGQGPNLVNVSEDPGQAHFTLFAPSSVLDQITGGSDGLRAWIDLSNIGPGTHDLPLQWQLPSNLTPLRLQEVSPKSVNMTLEALISVTLPIKKDVRGEPTLGYETGERVWDADSVTISGLQSDVERVVDIPVTLDISGADEDINLSLPLRPLDSDGRIVIGVTVSPESVAVTQTINIRGGYHNVVIRVVTVGQVADGYLQTSVSATPSNVMLFSPDPTLVEQLPGFIETEPLDLNFASDDIETVKSLILPENVTVIGDPNVLVQVGVAAIESSVTVARDLDLVGLMPGLMVQVSPQNVDIILYGPIPSLDILTQVDVRAIVDLSGLDAGTYQLVPDVIILPDRVRTQAIVPESVEVTIEELPTHTPTFTPTSTLTPMLTTTPSATVQP